MRLAPKNTCDKRKSPYQNVRRGGFVGLAKIAKTEYMSYVRCYRCGTKCGDGHFVRRDVKTHGGIRRCNICHLCCRLYDDEARNTAKIERRIVIFGILVAVGLIA